LPKISIGWVGCTNVTDRRQTTDGRTTTYSEHEHEFTFAKNTVVIAGMGTDSAALPQGRVSVVLPQEQYLFWWLIAMQYFFIQCGLSYVGITINEYALLPVEKRETEPMKKQNCTCNYCTINSFSCIWGWDGMGTGYGPVGTGM